jgi:ClpP class serine protease
VDVNQPKEATGVLDILWLFFIISSLQPVIEQKYLEASRQRLIRKIEKKRGSRVILMVHREETMSLLGFPVFRYIDINDSEQVLRAIHMTDPEVPIDLILHTPGGLVLAALQIARAVDRHKGKVTVFVPHYAMSGGTLIALAADEIIMSDHAVLGPVDPQLGQFPAASLLKVLRSKPMSEIDDETIVMADQGEKAIFQLRDSVRALLSSKMGQDRAEELSHILTEGTWTHDYPITFDTAQQLKLPVSSAMPDEVLQLMGLYPQPVRRQASVEYLSKPRHLDRPAARFGGTTGLDHRESVIPGLDRSQNII